MTAAVPRTTRSVRREAVWGFQLREESVGCWRGRIMEVGGRKRKNVSKVDQKDGIGTLEGGV